MALTTTYQAGVKLVQTGVADLGSKTYNLSLPSTSTMASGTGSNQADLAFTDQRTLAASGTENLDLAGGLTDQFGATLTFVKVKIIHITAASGNTNNVTVSPAATNGFLGFFNATADLISIPPGGQMFLAAPVSGWTVTAGTGDLLTVANSGAGTSVTYDVRIVGTSA